MEEIKYQLILSIGKTISINIKTYEDVINEEEKQLLEKDLDRFDIMLRGVLESNFESKNLNRLLGYLNTDYTHHIMETQIDLYCTDDEKIWCFSKMILGFFANDEEFKRLKDIINNINFYRNYNKYPYEKGQITKINKINN